MWNLIPIRNFFFLPSSTVEVSGQGQLQNIIQSFGALLKDTLAVWMLGNTQAAVTAGATGRKDFAGKLFLQNWLHDSSLNRNSTVV